MQWSYEKSFAHMHRKVSEVSQQIKLAADQMIKGGQKEEMLQINSPFHHHSESQFFTK